MSYLKEVNAQKTLTLENSQAVTYMIMSYNYYGMFKKHGTCAKKNGKVANSIKPR